MKKGIHPDYKHVVFRDVSCNVEFLTRSCVEARETTTVEGEQVALVSIDVSSASHPFYTGTQKMLDREGRVERFRRKYGFGGEAAEPTPPPEAGE